MIRAFAHCRSAGRFMLGFYFARALVPTLKELETPSLLKERNILFKFFEKTAWCLSPCLHFVVKFNLHSRIYVFDKF